MPNIRQRPEAPLAHANEVEHRRLIAQRANVGLPVDGTKPMLAPLVLKEYPTASLPTASIWDYGLAYDTTYGTLAYSDATAWNHLSTQTFSRRYSLLVL